MRRILFLERLFRIHQQHHHFGEANGIEGVGDGQLFELLLDAGATPHASGVVDAEALAVPGQLDRDGVPSNAGFRPRQQPLLAEQAVDQRRFPGIGAADHGNADGTWCPGLLAAAVDSGRFRLGGRHGGFGKRRLQRLVKIGKALPVLGRDRDRFAEAKFVGLEHAGPRRPALALVGDQDCRLARTAHEVGKRAVRRQRARAGVDQEQDRIRARDRGLGLLLHTAAQAFRRGLFEAGGVDDGEAEIAELRPALAPIARDAGQVIHQCEASADEAIEQRRLADVGPPDNGDGEAHDRRRVSRMPRYPAAAGSAISASPVDLAKRPRPTAAAMRATRRRRRAVVEWMADPAIGPGIGAAVAPVAAPAPVPRMDER